LNRALAIGACINIQSTYDDPGQPSKRKVDGSLSSEETVSSFLTTKKPIEDNWGYTFPKKPRHRAKVASSLLKFIAILAVYGSAGAGIIPEMLAPAIPRL